MQVIEESKNLISEVNVLINIVARNPDIPLALVTNVLKAMDRLEKAIGETVTESKGE